MFQILALFIFQWQKSMFFPDLGSGGHWRFLTGFWHLDLDLDIVRNLALTFPEVIISIRLVTVGLSSVEAQISYRLS